MKKRPRAKLLIILAAVVAVVVIAAVVVYNLFFAPIPIDDKHFPDPSVRLTVLNELDPDGDGLITRDEAAAVTDLDLEEAAEVSGLGVFPNLRTLTIGGGKLVEADITDCGSLEVVDVHGNGSLQELAVTKNPYLSSLNVRDTSLKELDLSANSNLMTLECDDAVVLENLDATPLEERWVQSTFSHKYPDAYNEGKSNTEEASAHYDSQGRLVSITDKHSDGGSYNSVYEYAYEYDDDDRVIHASCDAPNSSNDEDWTITYNENGQISEATGLNGALKRYEYDASGLPAVVSSKYSSKSSLATYRYAYQDGALTQISYDSGNGSVWVSDATMGSNGKIASISSNNQDASSTTCTYNDADQLASIASKSFMMSTSYAFVYGEGGKLSSGSMDFEAMSSSLYRSNPAISNATCEYNERGQLCAVKIQYRESRFASGEYKIGYTRLVLPKGDNPTGMLVNTMNPLMMQTATDFWDLGMYYNDWCLALSGSAEGDMARVRAMMTQSAE